MNNVEFNIEAMRIQKEYQITKLKREINALKANIQNEKDALKINQNPLVQSNLDYDSRRMRRLQQHLTQLKSRIL